jgi:hypothetical protein
MNNKRTFRFPLIALFLLMFYVAGLFTGLAFNWSRMREIRMRYERQELRLQRRSKDLLKMMEKYETKLDAIDDGDE